MLTNRCQWCQSNIYFGRNLIDTLFLKDSLCIECRNKLNVINSKFSINNHKGIAIYEYNEFLADTLFQYKNMYDIHLSSIYLYKQIVNIKRFIGINRQVLLVPSSRKQYELRRFNHLQHVFSCLNTKLYSPFIKLDDRQQKYLSSKERKNINIVLKENFKFNKKVVLVDDVMTTGSTINKCIELLENVGIKDIKIVILARQNLHKDNGKKS